MTVGSILQDEDSGLAYAQPKISYFLVADVEIRSDTGDKMTISGSKEIPIWSFSAPSPPVDTKDFPAEFVEVLHHPCRPNRLRKETFLVTVSSAEPSPLLLVRQKDTRQGDLRSVCQNGRYAIRFRRPALVGSVSEDPSQCHPNATDQDVLFNVLFQQNARTEYVEH